MEIFTDGSHSLNPKMSGVGAVIIDNGREYEVGTYTEKCANNNVAEVMAIAYAIKFIQEKKIDFNTKDNHIIIYSDSAYALQKIRDNLEGKDELEQKALNYIQNYLDNTTKKITFFQLKGHVHDGTRLAHYNNVADLIAGDKRYLGLVRYQDRKFRENYANRDKININILKKKQFER